MALRIVRYFDQTDHPAMVTVECPGCEQLFGLGMSAFAEECGSKIHCPFCRIEIQIDKPKVDPITLLRMTLDTADLMEKHGLRNLSYTVCLNAIGAHIREILEFVGYRRIVSISNDRWAEFLSARKSRKGKPCLECKETRVVSDQVRTFLVCPVCFTE